MSRAAVIGLLVLACGPTAAAAAPNYLATGAFTERGRGVRGHGAVLRNALAYELSHGCGFALVVDDATKARALARIRATNRHSVDERHWVQIGNAVGATHLLLGEVRQDRNTCSAFAQLVHLESRATKVTRPTYYDCTNYDLVELAGDLSEQLAGGRASPPTERRHRRPPRAPVEIVMRGREAEVDGVEYTFYELERAPRDASSQASDDTPASTDPETTPTPPPDAPPPIGPRQAPPPRAATFDLERFPALAPSYADDGTPILNLFALARLVDTRGALVASGVLTLPVLFLLLGALLLRARPNLGQAWLRFGFNLSVLLASVAVAVILLYGAVLERELFEDTAAYVVLAPFASLAIWIAGGRLLRILPLLRLLRQTLWALVMTSSILAALLLGTQIQMPAVYLGAGCILLWLAARAAVSLRRKRKLS